jgi:hypothetical protein
VRFSFSARGKKIEQGMMMPQSFAQKKLPSAGLGSGQNVSTVKA